MDGGLAHELLHAVDHSGAQLLGSSVIGLLQPRLNAFQSEFLASTFAFEQTFRNQQKSRTGRQRNQGRLASCVREQPQG